MAVQNFLAGGFIGKLGEVVGQRWRNVRTVRSHVIPKNPQTVPQQAMRGRFAQANQNAKVAFLNNKGLGSWQGFDSPQYSLMVGQAVRNIQAGGLMTAALPVYPDALIPDNNITDAYVDWSLWPAGLRIRSPTFTMPVDMPILLYIFYFNTNTSLWQWSVTPFSYPAGAQIGTPYTIPAGQTFPAGACAIVTANEALNTSGQTLKTNGVPLFPTP